MMFNGVTNPSQWPLARRHNRRARGDQRLKHVVADERYVPFLLRMAFSCAPVFDEPSAEVAGDAKLTDYAVSSLVQVEYGGHRPFIPFGNLEGYSTPDMTRKATRR